MQKSDIELWSAGRPLSRLGGLPLKAEKIYDASQRKGGDPPSEGEIVMPSQTGKGCSWVYRTPGQSNTSVQRRELQITHQIDTS